MPMKEQIRLRQIKAMQAEERRDEQAILDALNRARQPVTARQIGHEVGMAEPLVRTRIQGLTEKGTDLGPNLATDAAAMNEALRRASRMDRG